VNVVVTHPGRQHSHQAALGLQAAGLLAGYWAGVPVTLEQRRRIPAPLRGTVIGYAPVPLDAAKVRWFPWTPALRRAGDALLPRSAACRADFAACRLFDRWAARALRRLLPGLPGAVIACEISALATFRAARELGVATVLDAPSIHHAAQDRLHGFGEPEELHRRIVRVKDQEIALADHILCVSELARETYLAAGAPAEKVHAVPLGADLEVFTPGDGSAPGEPFTFLFSGATIHRKGFDLLMAAFERVAAEEPGVRLRIVGPRGDLGHLLDGAGPEIEFLGRRGQAELAEELRRADCFVLPSRNDSFGMVVAEALASGVPAIVSEMVGSKLLVTEGETGWMVPFEDVDALAARMLGCARSREAVRSMRPACRRAAQAASWPAYHERLAELFRRLFP
jgi:glycosyltransferase involved in cell wall biosynthesis